MKRLSSGFAFRLAAWGGLLAVGLGAFGTHALKGLFLQLGTTVIWEKAVFYHLVHVVVLLLLGTLDPFPRRAWLALAFGVLGFSGSLYVYALTHAVWLTFITPFGGLSLMVGWLLLALGKGVGNLTAGSDRP